MGSMKLTDSKDSKLVIYSDINSFLVKQGFDNMDDLAYIYRMKFEMFNEIRGWNFKDAKPYVVAIKKATQVSPIVAWRYKLLTIKSLIKDLYLILPDNFACMYYRLLKSIKMFSSLR